MSDIVIFESDTRPVEVRLEGETVWLTQRQMGELFDKDVRTINEHVGNVFSEGELEPEATIRKFRIVRQEGARQVERQIEHYNLDVIISVGYRVKSQRGVRFRQWATRVLREHLTQGYSLNEHRLAQQGLADLERAVELLGTTLTRRELVSDLGEEVIQLILGYARTWRLLQDYDRGELSVPPAPARPAAFWRWRRPGGRWMRWLPNRMNGARPPRCSPGTVARGWSPSSATWSRACSASRCTAPARSAPPICCTS